MVVLGSTLVYHTLQWLYLTSLLYYTPPWALLESTTLNHTSSTFRHALLRVVNDLWCNVSVLLISPSSDKKRRTPVKLYIQYRDQSRWENYIAQWTCGVDNYTTETKIRIAIKFQNIFEQCTSEYCAGAVTNHCYHDPQVLKTRSWFYLTLLCSTTLYSNSIWLFYSTTLHHCFAFFYLTLCNHLPC